MKKLQFLSNLTPGREGVVKIIENTYCAGTKHLSNLEMKKKVESISFQKTALITIFILLAVFWALKNEVNLIKLTN
jgi:hypothetical protein